MDIFFNGVWRMDWGLGNPNKTAALIAMLMVAVWSVAAIRRGGFWVALAGFTILGGCLIHTLSRGGIVAAAAGLLPMAIHFFPGLSKARKMSVVCSLAGLVIFAFLLNADQRFALGIREEDASISNRLAIWRTAPRMMVDAPGGWGLGQAGDAYMQWYQPVERLEGYRTLVNSHLTWLVEFGWPMRVLYVFGWLFVMALCCSEKRTLLRMPAFGVWIAFAIGATFSSVAESLWLWIIPLVFLGIVLTLRIRNKRWPPRRIWVISFVGALAVNAGLFAWGSGTPAKWEIQKHGERVIIGSGQPTIWIVINEKILGKTYGKTWRKFASHADGATLAFVKSVRNIPTPSGTLVLAGSCSDSELDIIQAALPQWKRLVLLNPGFPPDKLNIGKEVLPRTFVVFGSLIVRPALPDWRKKQGIDFQEVPGAAEYLPNWPQFINLNPAVESCGPADLNCRSEIGCRPR